MVTMCVRVLILVSGIALTAAPAFAQSPAAPAPVGATAAGIGSWSAFQPAGAPPDWPRSYIVGRSGITFGTRTAPLVGVEIGGRVAPMLQIYSAFDWHRDVAPDFVEDIGDIVSFIVGADVDYKFPAFTGVGGLRVIAPRGKVRPYGLGGFGFGHVSGKVMVEGEDVTGVLDALGYLDRDDLAFTKSLFEIGGGVAISQGRFYADLSYRFQKFLQTGEPINISGVYAGVGVGF